MVMRARKNPEQIVQGWTLIRSTAEAIMGLSSTLGEGLLGWTSSTLSLPLASVGTLANGYQKSSVLTAHHDALIRQLDALHAAGIWTGQQHAARCEAIMAVQLGLKTVWQAVEPRREKNPTRAAHSRANKRKRSADDRRVA